MTRKLTASTCMLVMALLITLKHPVLGYCLCLDSYFTVNCVCVEEDTPQNTCNGCCDTSHTQNTHHSPQKPTPCDDCTEHLTIDVGQFVWNSTNDIPADAESLFNIQAHQTNDSFIHLSPFFLNRNFRSNPPPDYLIRNFPLSSRHDVLRL